MQEGGGEAPRCGKTLDLQVWNRPFNTHFGASKRCAPPRGCGFIASCWGASMDGGPLWPTYSAPVKRLKEGPASDISLALGGNRGRSSKRFGVTRGIYPWPLVGAARRDRLEFYYLYNGGRHRGVGTFPADGKCRRTGVGTPFAEGNHTPPKILRCDEVGHVS